MSVYRDEEAQSATPAERARAGSLELLFGSAIISAQSTSHSPQRHARGKDSLRPLGSSGKKKAG
jgi:hypothetical protein